MKARYQISLALNEEDYRRLEELRRKGFKLIGIFRKGLEEGLKHK